MNYAENKHWPMRSVWRTGPAQAVGGYIGEGHREGYRVGKSKIVVKRRSNGYIYNKVSFNYIPYLD